VFTLAWQALLAFVKFNVAYGKLLALSSLRELWVAVCFMSAELS